jgi:hypothetical protein
MSLNNHRSFVGLVKQCLPQSPRTIPFYNLLAGFDAHRSYEEVNQKFRAVYVLSLRVGLVEVNFGLLTPGIAIGRISNIRFQCFRICVPGDFEV